MINPTIIVPTRKAMATISLSGAEKTLANSLRSLAAISFLVRAFTPERLVNTRMASPNAVPVGKPPVEAHFPLRARFPAGNQLPRPAASIRVVSHHVSGLFLFMQVE